MRLPRDTQQGEPLILAAGARIAACVAGLVLLAGWQPSAAELRRGREPDDLPAQALAVVPPSSLGGSIGAPGDRDLYAVRLEAGQSLQADILARGFRAGSQPGSDLSALLEILDGDGATVLAQDQSLGDFDDPMTSFTAPAAGVYYVSVENLDPGAGGPSFVYVLSLEAESNDTFASASRILPPDLPSIDALIDPAGDRDCYRLEAAGGEVLTADVDSAVFNPVQPPAKMVASLYDPALSLIAEDAYTSADPEDPFIQTTLGAPGTYYLCLRELRAYVGTSNTFYQLSVRIGPAADDDAFATANPVVLPRTVSGVSSPSSDVDHFLFSLGGAATLTADVDAAEDLLSLLQGTVRVHDASGVLASDSSTPDPSLSVSLPGGVFSVSIEGGCSGTGCKDEDAYYALHLDADADQDGLRLPFDNCPMDDNPSQADADGDGVGDACDVCPALFDPAQADGDGDGMGNACSPCGPTEVGEDMQFTDPVTLSWSADPGVDFYDLYRGTFSASGWTWDPQCVKASFPAPEATDAGSPAGGFYYLLAGRGPCGATGTGAGSAGPRSLPSPCP